jgi:hypothetical protein
MYGSPYDGHTFAGAFSQALWQVIIEILPLDAKLS